MEQAFRLFVATTIVCSVWSAFLWLMLPIGFVDGFYVDTKLELTELVGDREAGRLMSKFSGHIASATRGGVIAAAVPLLATMSGWCVWGYRRLTGARSQEAAGGGQGLQRLDANKGLGDD